MQYVLVLWPYIHFCIYFAVVFSWTYVYGPFFFEEKTVKSEGVPAMLQNWLMELLFEGERADFIFESHCKIVSESYSA